MMYRRFIAIVLAVLIFVCALPCSAFAAEETSDTKKISVVWMGTSFSETVLEKDGGIYVPISWLTYFGLLMCKENDTEYEYYYADQEKPGSFAKRIFIEKEDLSFSICYYLPKYNLGLEMGAYNIWIADSLDALDASDGQEFVDKLLEAWKKKDAAIEYSKTRANYVSIYEGSFGDCIDYDGEKYLPIAELLPLMNAKIAVGNDGALYIEPNLTTLSQALYNADIGSLCFNAEDDIWGDEFVSAGGLVVDSLTSFRFDRLDFIWNSGRVADYEEIFKAYLTEDETYLSAYDKEITPQGRALNLGKDLLKTANTAYKYLKTEKKLFDSFGWDTDEYPEFSFLEDIDENIKVNGADIVGGVYKAFDYWNAYCHQVDDHREMLNAVYSYDKNDSKQKTPSYRAAMTTYSLYSEKYAGRLLSATSECLQDYITQELPKKALMEKVPAIAPYALTVEITKLILPEEYKTIHTDSLIYVMDAATEKSYDVFLERKYSGQYDADSLNALRLCAIMSLISSKYAYESIWGEHYEKIDRINELLEKLYLAADGVDGDSSDYYEKKRDKLNADLSKLNTNTKPKYLTDYLGMTLNQVAEIWGDDYEMPLYTWSMNEGAVEMQYQDDRLPFYLLISMDLETYEQYTSGKRSFTGEEQINLLSISGDAPAHMIVNGLSNKDTYADIIKKYPDIYFIENSVFGTYCLISTDKYSIRYTWYTSDYKSEVADLILCSLHD